MQSTCLRKLGLQKITVAFFRLLWNSKTEFKHVCSWGEEGCVIVFSCVCMCRIGPFLSLSLLPFLFLFSPCPIPPSLSPSSSSSFSFSPSSSLLLIPFSPHLCLFPLLLHSIVLPLSPSLQTPKENSARPWKLKAPPPPPPWRPKANRMVAD